MISTYGNTGKVNELRATGSHEMNFINLYSLEWTGCPKYTEYLKNGFPSAGDKQ